MSVKIMSMVWQNATDLQGNDLIVMLALADWSNDVGRCWPSVPALADKARVSERTARYILRRLADGGYVQIAEQRGRNHTNQYLLNLQVLGGVKGQPLQVIEGPENLQVATENLQVATLKPAIAIAPEPLGTVKEPSESARGLRPVPKTSTTPPAKPLPFPPDFALTTDLVEWATSEGITALIDLRRITNSFVEYWTDGEGQGQRKKNWTLTWKNWVRREAERVPKVRTNGHAPYQATLNLQSEVPPHGYSWDGGPGKWRKMERGADGLWPFGCATFTQAQRKNEEAEAQFYAAREEAPV
jgi:hypothetical protein